MTFESLLTIVLILCSFLFILTTCSLTRLFAACCHTIHVLVSPICRLQPFIYSTRTSPAPFLHSITHNDTSFLS
ncbi:hypothetical protein FPV67DRAFT_230475 [Lyophyllum atratum]|nr:hypothetical protein FPV67DRAFT_230475 [Lyophyllum atratum]